MAAPSPISCETITTAHSQEQGKDSSAKEIAGLYSRLQATVDKTQGTELMHSEAKYMPAPPSLPMSPSSSSPTPVRMPESNRGISTPRSSSDDIENGEAAATSAPCPCQHILETMESTTCSLCQRTIPIMEQLQQERKMQEKEIQLLEVRIQEEQEKIRQQLEEIEVLQAAVAKVQEKLNIKEEEFNALKNDMEILNEKYVDEIERVAEIQHSKDMIESELEDLSRRLFEEANGMVANEKREKHNLELAQRQLEKQLQETRERLGAEQMQLKELRTRMTEMAQMQDQQRKRASQTTDSGDGSAEDASVDADHSSVISSQMAALNVSPTPELLDPMVLAEFEELVKYGATVPLKKLHTLSFMKNCLAEDVEPCLRFGANPRLSARKISDAIVMNTCFIEEAPAGFEEEQARRPPDMPLKISASRNLLWERLSNGGTSPNVFSGCQACGRQDQSPLPYRFRISYFDDWACIDRFCRDRLVAVCEFYVFIRNIRQGYYSSRSLHELHQESIRLRLQMFYARMGALPWTLRSFTRPENPDASTDPLLETTPTASESSPLPRSSAKDDPSDTSASDTHPVDTSDQSPRRSSALLDVLSATAATAVFS